MAEEQIFKDILKKNKLRVTATRLKIFKLFMKTEEHVTVEEMYNRVRKSDPGIGYATVHRTLKLLAAHDLARELDLGDRVWRYEHILDHEHHDHLVCLGCGRTIEFLCPQIETRQERIVEQYKFRPERHRLQIYGWCETCWKKRKKGELAHAGTIK